MKKILSTFLLLIANIQGMTITDPNAQSYKFGSFTIHVVNQNMFTLPAQVAVNAANHALRGGGGVDGVTHRIAGPELLQQLIKRYPKGTPTGTAVVSDSFNLTKKGNNPYNPGMLYIIHAVGPICSEPVTAEQKEQLKNAHYQSLQRANELKLKSIAFSAISSGIYGCNTQLVAQQAAQAVTEFLRDYPNTSLTDIYFSLYGDPNPQETKQKVTIYNQVFKEELMKYSLSNLTTTLETINNNLSLAI